MLEASDDGELKDYIDFPDGILMDGFDQSNVTFDYIDVDRLGNKAIVIHNVITLQECAQIRDFIDSFNRAPLFVGDVVLTPANSKHQYRNNLRILAKSKSIADALFSRLAPVLESIGEHEILCTAANSDSFLNGGMGMRGLWKIHSLNYLFRLCKYDPLGHFGPHYDGDYVIDPCSLRSLKTFMIYINDDYEGGETSFADDHDMHFDPNRGIYCSPNDKVFTQLKARAGDLLIFDHKLLHEGKQVLSGGKYIMRSDVMFERSDVVSMTEEDKTCVQAVKLFHEGMKLEEAHRIDEAVAKYRQAYKLYPELEKYS